MAEQLHEALHEAYDVDVAKLNRLAARSAERAEKLKAENEKLEKRLAQYGLFREVVGDPAVEFANLRRELHRVERENEKLRELVRDMYTAFFRLNIDHCQACPRDTINGPCTMYIVGGSDECHFEKTMRELGIEVDG